MKHQTPCRARQWNPEAGVTLLETAIALSVLFIVSAGLMSLATVAIVNSENQGHLLARTNEYAQDKMEQIVNLQFNDLVSDTTVFPTCTPTATTVCAPGSGLAVGGSADPTAAVNLYVDYLDRDGNPLGGGVVRPNNWFYVRVWQIDGLNAGPTLKRITISVQTGSSAGMRGEIPTSTLSMVRADPW